MSGQKESAGGSPGKDSKEEKKAKKLAQQKAEKKARIAAVKEAKKAEEEKPKDEAGPSHRFQPVGFLIFLFFLLEYIALITLCCGQQRDTLSTKPSDITDCWM